MATIGEIRAADHWLLVACKTCRHAVYVPWTFLPDRLPDDLPDRLAAAHFRCKKCGGKELESSAADLLAGRPSRMG